MPDPQATLRRINILYLIEELENQLHRGGATPTRTDWDELLRRLRGLMELAQAMETRRQEVVNH